MDDNIPATPDDERSPSPHRRTVLKGAAWSVPIVAAAVAVPAQAASCLPLANVTQMVTPSGGARGDATIAIPNRDRLKEVRYVVVGGSGANGGGAVPYGHQIGQGGAGRRIVGTIPAALVVGNMLRAVAAESGQNLRGGYGYTNGGAASTSAAGERIENAGSGGGSSALALLGSNQWIIAAGGGGGGGGQVSGNHPYAYGADALRGDPESSNLWGDGGAVGSAGQWGTSGAIATWGDTFTGARWSGIRGAAGGGVGGGDGAGGVSNEASYFEAYGAGSPGGGGHGGRSGYWTYNGLKLYTGGGGGAGRYGGGGGMAYSQAERWDNGAPNGTRIYGGSGGGGGSSYVDPGLMSTMTSQDAVKAGSGWVQVTFVYEPCP